MGVSVRWVCPREDFGAESVQGGGGGSGCWKDQGDGFGKSAGFYVIDGSGWEIGIDDRFGLADEVGAVHLEWERAELQL